jgi:hypothetical protein
MDNPWTSGIISSSIMFVVLGLVSGWVYYRVNNTRLYFQLSMVFLVQAVFLFLFFRSGHPHPFLFAIEGIMALALLVLGNALITCVLIKFLPRLGVDEVYFINLEDGSLRRSFMFFSSIFFLMVASAIFKSSVGFLTQILGNLYWVFIVILIPFLAIVSFYYMPWRTGDDTLLLGEEKRSVSLENVFSICGQVTRAEIIIFPLVTLCVWTLTLFLGKIHEKVDFFGIIFFVILIYLIVRGELQREKRNSCEKK